MNNKKLLELITKERPVGTANNEEVLEILEKEFVNEGYKINSLPFECEVWKNGYSKMVISDKEFIINASPYSKPFLGEGEAIIIDSLEELQEMNIKDKIVFLCGKSSQNSLQPKDYPFYYPDEDKAIISLFELQKPKAIVAFTGKSRLSGMEPFPMFEDGNFIIPSAYAGEEIINSIRELVDKNPFIKVKIDSEISIADSRQLIAYKNSGNNKKGKIVVCAHMDTKYNTEGALDNAAGIAVLMKTAEKISEAADELNIEFIPFNGEEYFAASGEVNYLNNNKDKIDLVINIDSPCHKDSLSAISSYNLSKEKEEVLEKIINAHNCVIKGQQWYAGDHCAFVFQGIPSLAISSADLFRGALEYTHTPKDTLETVDEELITATSKFLSKLIQKWNLEN